MDEHKILENFGINFKHYRNKAKMSQEDVVEITGINAVKFANTINKTIDELIKDL